MTAEAEEQTPIRGLRRVSDELDRTVAAPVRRTRPLRQRLRLPLMLAGPLVVAVVASWWYLTSGRYVSTDDAYIQAARTMISTDIAGRVVSVEVKDNQRVKAGQVLFKLDDRPFRIAVEDTTAQLAAARLQISALRSTYQQKLADQKAAEETLTYQQREFDRQRQLAATGVASRQMFDQTQMAVDVARQKLVATQHDLGNILAQLGGDLESPIDDHPSVQRARAALDRAQLDLSYAVVRAPDSGIVTKVEQLQPGNYVIASTPVFSLVSDRIWVEANFKETELTHMRAGQEATVEIDTYAGTVCHAKIQSLSPGTGLTFSLLPPENATGNWVKVVQRLPVRLELDKGCGELPLHAGLSVTAEVDTKHQNPWMVWLDHSISRALGTAQAGETK